MKERFAIKASGDHMERPPGSKEVPWDVNYSTIQQYQTWAQVVWRLSTATLKREGEYLVYEIGLLICGFFPSSETSTDPEVMFQEVKRRLKPLCEFHTMLGEEYESHSLKGIQHLAQGCTNIPREWSMEKVAAFLGVWKQDPGLVSAPIIRAMNPNPMTLQRIEQKLRTSDHWWFADGAEAGSCREVEKIWKSRIKHMPFRGWFARRMGGMGLGAVADDALRESPTLLTAVLQGQNRDWRLGDYVVSAYFMREDPLFGDLYPKMVDVVVAEQLSIIEQSASRRLSSPEGKAIFYEKRMQPYTDPERIYVEEGYTPQELEAAGIDTSTFQVFAHDYDPEALRKAEEDREWEKRNRKKREQHQAALAAIKAEISASEFARLFEVEFYDLSKEDAYEAKKLYHKHGCPIFGDAYSLSLFAPSEESNVEDPDEEYDEDLYSDEEE